MRLHALAALAVAVMSVPAGASAAPSVLYSVSAPSSVIAPTGALAGRIAVPASSRMAWFTDRPARRAGHGTIADLRAGWKANRFDRVPPNAVIVAQAADGTRTQSVVVLSAPRRSGRAISFGYRVVPAEAVAGMSHVHAPPPGRHGNTALFVDDGTTPPCNRFITDGGDCVLAAGRWAEVGPLAGNTASVSGCRNGALPASGVALTAGAHSDRVSGRATAYALALCGDMTSLGTATTVAVPLTLYPDGPVRVLRDVVDITATIDVVLRVVVAPLT